MVLVLCVGAAKLPADFRSAAIARAISSRHNRSENR
jgi:hypothetical protein